jgi:hypothetical protein
LLDVLQKKKVGDKISLAIQRGDEEITIETELTGRPGTRQQQAPPSVWIGVTGVDREGKVVLTAITAEGPSAKAGLKKGDVIVKSNDKDVENYAKLIESIRKMSAGEKLKLQVARGEETIDITVTLAQAAAPAVKPINVIYVADVDLMASAFLRIRARPDEDQEINWRFENVSFLLNIIDELAGENSYVEIRMRKPLHTTLRQIEESAQQARNAEFAQQEAFQDRFQEELKSLDEEKEKALKKYTDRLEKLRENPNASMADRVALEQAKQIEEQRITQRQEVTRRQMQQELNKRIEQIRRESDLGIQSIQNWYKFWAVFIPPIPPLLVCLIVFVHRRLREREGVTKARLR